MTWRQSPAMPTSGTRTLPSSAGSMSTWMTLASGANASDFAGDPVVEARPHADQQVALLERGHRRVVPVHAGHPQGLRMRVRERAACHECRHDRDAGAFGQNPQWLCRARLEGAPADVEDRALGRGDQLRRLGHQHRVTEGDGVVPRQVELVDRGGPVPLHRRVRNVLGQIDEDRAGAARGGHVEGGRHHPRNVVDILDEPVVLRDAHRDARDVALLEGIGADGRRCHLARHDHQRSRVHVGVGQWRHDVGGPGPARDHGHAGPAGHHGVPLGHVPGALLVADQDVADGRVDDRVVHRQDGAAGQAEHDVDALHLEALDEGLCSCELHWCSPVAWSLGCRSGRATN